MTCCCLCRTNTLSDCSLASLSSAVLAANLAWLEAVIFRSLASLSSAVSSASLSVIRCSLAYLTSSVSTASLRLLCCSCFGSLSSVHGRPSLVLFYGVAYSLSALHDSVVPFEEVVCAFVASIAEEKPVVLPRVLCVRVVETREIQLLSESARNWNCKIRALNYVNMEYAARRTYHIWYVEIGIAKLER